MAKMQQECMNCGRKFFTNKIKVYVFKERDCPDCKVTMFCHDNLYYECLKCGKKFDLKDEVAIASLSLHMKGTSRSFEEREKKVAKGLEAEKIEIPDNRVCRRCQNITAHIRNIIDKQENIPSSVKAKIRTLSDEEYLNTFFKHIQKQMKVDTQPKPPERFPLRSRLKLPDIDKEVEEIKKLGEKSEK